MSIKPKVIGYECVEWGGIDESHRTTPLMSKQEMIEASIFELVLFGVKSRYRPIYSTEKAETYERVYRYIQG